MENQLKGTQTCYKCGIEFEFDYIIDCFTVYDSRAGETVEVTAVKCPSC